MKTLGNQPLIDDPVSLHLRFDEVLTPGENFNDSIKEALQKSGLFVLSYISKSAKSKAGKTLANHKAKYH